MLMNTIDVFVTSISRYSNFYKIHAIIFFDTSFSEVCILIYNSTRRKITYTKSLQIMFNYDVRTIKVLFKEQRKIS